MPSQGLRRGEALRAVFQQRNYRLLWAGQALALPGEQINLIALPWLALQLTSDALALGSVLAARGLPPAILTLAGGVTADRFSPRAILLACDALRLALARRHPDRLHHPVAAVCRFPGLGPAGGVFSAGCRFDRPGRPPRSEPADRQFSLSEPGPARGVRRPGAGRDRLRRRPCNRLCRCPGRARSRTRHGVRPVRPRTPGLGRHPVEDAPAVLAGPLTVGVPLLSKLRLPEGAAAFGLIAAGFGGGNLLGSLLAGVFRRTRGLALLLTVLIAGFGVSLWILSQAPSMGVAFLALLAAGTGNGYLGAVVRTVLHRRAPPDPLGRVMSLYFFGNTALVPVSQAVSGVVIGFSLEGLFQGGGFLLVLLAAWLALSPVPRLVLHQAEQAW